MCLSYICFARFLSWPEYEWRLWRLLFYARQDRENDLWPLGWHNCNQTKKVALNLFTIRPSAYRFFYIEAKRNKNKYNVFKFQSVFYGRDMCMCFRSGNLSCLSAFSFRLLSFHFVNDLMNECAILLWFGKWYILFCRLLRFNFGFLIPRSPAIASSAIFSASFLESACQLN